MYSRPLVLVWWQPLLRAILVLSLIAGACAGARLGLILRPHAPVSGEALLRSGDVSPLAHALRALDVNGDGIPDLLPPEAAIDTPIVAKPMVAATDDARCPQSCRFPPLRQPPRL